MSPDLSRFTTLDEVAHQVMKRLGWTQNQLGAEIDMHPSAISRVCNQKSGRKAERVFVEQLLAHISEQLTAEELYFCKEYLAWIDAYNGAWTTDSWETYWHRSLGSRDKQVTVHAVPRMHKPICNLPIPLTPLLGRQHEVQEITTQVLPDGPQSRRLFTLTGPGGVGKTRLAIECGWTLLDQFRDGIYLVELAGLQSADLVVGTIAQVLSVHIASGRSPLDAIQRWLAERSILLILDNFEHLLEAAPTVVDLLERCAALTVLVTSRTRLSLYGEHEYVVSPLVLPKSNGEQGDNPAIALFCERAVAANHRFAPDQTNMQAILDICTWVDGLPLAIELAAAQVKYMPVNELRDQLRHADNGAPRLLQSPWRNHVKRHQSVWSTIAWSYALLSEDEQRCLRQMALFVGGFTPEAAVRICQAGTSSLPINAILQSLVDKSLIQLHRTNADSDGNPDNLGDAPTTRYRMLELIRQFGLEELKRHGETEIAQQRHAQYYIAYLDQLKPKSEDHSKVRMLRSVRIEYDNIRATFSCCHRQGNSKACIHLCISLVSFWVVDSSHEAVTWLYETETLARNEPASPTYAEFLAVLGFFVIRAYGRLAGRIYIERALAMNMQTGNRVIAKRIGMAYGMLAWICFYHDGDYVAADQHFASAQANDEAAGDDWALAMTLANRGQMALRLGEYSKADEFYQKSLSIHQRNGDPWGLALTLNNLAELHLHRNQLRRAVEFLDAAQVQTEHIDSSDQLAQNHCLRAHLMLIKGNVAKAQALLRPLFTETFTSLMVQYQLDRICFLVPLAEQLQQPFHALTLAAAIDANLIAAQIILPPQDQPWLQEAIARIRKQLTPEERRQVQARGETFSMEQTIAYAKMIVELPLPEDVNAEL